MLCLERARKLELGNAGIVEGGLGQMQEAARLKCVDEFERDGLREMQEVLAAAPFEQPLVFLRVHNTSLYGTDDAFETLYRKMPKSYLTRRFPLLGDTEVHVGNKAAVKNDSKANLFTGLGLCMSVCR